MPVLLAAADKLITAFPLLPDVRFNFNHPIPDVSILHAPLLVNDKAFVPPLSGMVSVILATEICGESTFDFLHELTEKRVIKTPAIP